MVSPDFPERGPDSHSLQEEASATPESAWFFAWLKSAGLYLGAVTAYLGVATALFAAWKKYVAPQGVGADITIWALAAVLTLPLLFAFLFNLLPSLRRRRERNLRPTGAAGSGYFTTAPREDDPYQFFAKGYELFLEWAGSPKAPLLHLTGLSGSGKSSLIGAYLKPRLASMETGPKTTVLTVRSYIDPLAAMKESLLALWKKTPADYQDLCPLEALRRAVRQLDASDRLLVTFDQFEEFFLLRAGAVGMIAKDGLLASAPGPVAQGEFTALRDFLHAFVADPPERVAILLSYREDHRRLFAPLRLPARQEGQNWMTIEPFDFATADAFLRSCPGLAVPEGRMQRVLQEAARQEGSRVIMRPIVANLLGLILQRMSGHPTLWRRTGDLLRGYVSDCLGEELKEERASVLRALLTDFQTARPRSVAEVCRETGLDPAAIDVQLEHLGRAGLLRCLTPGQSDFTRRTWQIAHDFLATLIERALAGLRRTLWRTVRPWLAPAALAIAFTLGLIWPWMQKHRTISFLANAGFTWNEPNSTIVAATVEARGRKQLDDLSSAFRRLNPWSLDLRFCATLKNVDVRGLTSLMNLNLNWCSALQNVDGLQGLTSLLYLDLGGCALQNVDGLQGLTSLLYLDLGGCEALQNVDVLRGLTSLDNLNLSYCDALQTVDGLRSLTSLQSLDLSECEALQDVNVLRGLTSLQSLNLKSCHKLQNVDGLRGLTSLQSLDLSSCYALQNVDILRGLTSLLILDLSYCRKLQNVDGLRGLTSLQTLDLSHCDALQNVDGLKGLTALQTLDLSDCRKLQNVDGLQRLTVLQTLDLSQCAKLQNVDGLQGLTSLQNLDLSKCFALQNVDGLQGLTKLQSLKLHECRALQDVDGLKYLTSLEYLYLSNCDALQDLDGLQGLTSLQSLDLSRCNALQNVDVLKYLTSLQRLYLSNCDALQNVDGLRGLTSLEYLDLEGCKALPRENMNALRTALPKAGITFPDGSVDIP